MLEGLEIAEIKLSEAFKNKDLRVDSDFWTKEPYRNPKLKYERIGNVLKKAQYGISISMNEDNIGYPIYRMNEIHNMLTDLNVDKSADISREEFLKFKLKDRDVLFNRTNSYEWVGRTGLYRQVEKEEYTFASYLVRFVPDESIINPEYLTAFLNTKYGVNDIKRRSRQSINQTNVNPEEVKEILFPILNKSIQLEIKNCFDTAHESRLKSKQLYQQAETLLLETLGLKDSQPSTDPINVKSFKESFLATGRLDAEYYQKKYEEVESLLKSNGFKLISEISKLINYGTVPTSPYTEDGSGIPYIKGMNLKNTNITTEKLDRIINTENLPEKFYTKKGDIIISQMGTVGDVGVVRDEVGWLFASFTIRVRLKNNSGFDPVFLGLYIQNIAKPYYLYRNIAQASVRQNTDLPTIRNLYVPIVDYTKQQEIAELVDESFRLKNQSEQLLETAKRAVEIAIEKDENEALKFIESVSA
ncbi:MAG: restriction endonuclease subunit S [Candidatus Kapaibacterium sp.]